MTLRDAHEVMGRCRPAADASLGAWLAYHERGQALYREIAEMDRFHHHEALYWANHEREKVAAVQSRIASAGSTQDGSGQA